MKFKLKLKQHDRIKQLRHGNGISLVVMRTQ